MITDIQNRACEWDDCGRPATSVVYSRGTSEKDHGVGAYCDAHAHELIDSERPEYCEHCPNCGCVFGVN